MTLNRVFKRFCVFFSYLQALHDFDDFKMVVRGFISNILNTIKVTVLFSFKPKNRIKLIQLVINS